MSFPTVGSNFRCILPKPVTILFSNAVNANYTTKTSSSDTATPAITQQPFSAKVERSAPSTLLVAELPILCSSCDQVLDGPCVRHSAKHIMDMPPLPRAISSLPNELALRNLSDSLDDELSGKSSQKAVFAKVAIPQCTIFGPLVAPLGKENMSTCADFALQTQSGWMDCSLESIHACNWMKFVRFAANKMEQNLLAYTQDGAIYFSALREIQPDDELKVWYCQNYGDLLRKPVLKLEDYSKCITGAPAKLAKRPLKQIASANKNPAETKSRSTSDKHPDVRKNKTAKSAGKVVSAGRVLTRRKRKISETCTDDQNLNLGVMGSLGSELVGSSGEQPSCFPSDTQRLSQLQADALPETETQPAEREVRAEIGSSEQLSSVAPKSVVKKLNKNKRNFQCKDCLLRYTDAACLQIHAVSHGGVRPEACSKCPACESEFTSFELLKEHIESHRFSLTKYNCRFCKEVFGSRVLAEDHERTVHKELIGQKKPKRKSASYVPADGFRCSCCNLRFESSRLKTYHEKNLALLSGNYPCPACLKTFSSQVVFREHGVEHCVDGTYPCRICNKSYPVFKRLILHMECQHTGKMLTCEVCGYATRDPKAMNHHMVVHSNNFEFKCKFCPREFKQSEKLRCHMKRFHGPENAKMQKNAKSRRGLGRDSSGDYMNYVYKCRDCKLGFLTQRQLVRHLSDVHPEKSIYSVPELNLPVIKAVKFECSVCKKMFVSKERRLTHIETVHPEVVSVVRNSGKNGEAETVLPPQRDVEYMAHWCSDCDVQFNSAARLLQHIFARHPEKDLSCLTALAEDISV